MTSYPDVGYLISNHQKCQENHSKFRSFVYYNIVESLIKLAIKIGFQL